MPNNLQIFGTIYEDVSSVTFKDTNNVSHTFPDTSDTTATAANVLDGKYFYNALGERTLGTMQGGVSSIPLAMRPDAELVQRWSDDYLLHADKSITIPAYTTSATTLVASSNLTPTVTIDRNNYDYLVIIRCLAYPIYDSTTAVKGRVEYFLGMNHSEYVYIPAGVVAPINGDSVTYLSTNYNLYTPAAKYRMVYWTSASAISIYSSAAYGVYQSITAPTVSGTTMIAKTPTVAVRGSTTYFTQTAWEMMTDIREQYTIDLYRAPKYALNQNGFLEQSAIFSLIDGAQSETHTLI